MLLENINEVRQAKDICNHSRRGWFFYECLTAKENENGPETCLTDVRELLTMYTAMKIAQRSRKWRGVVLLAPRPAG